MWVLQIYVFPSLFHLTSEVKRKRSWNISPSVSGWLGDHKNKWEMRGGREVTLITSHKIVSQGIGELAIGWNADECEGNWCIRGIGICEQRNKGVFRREAFRIMISSRTFLKQFALVSPGWLLTVVNRKAWADGSVVLLVLVEWVYKPPQLENAGFLSQWTLNGSATWDQEWQRSGTSNDGGGTSNGSTAALPFKAPTPAAIQGPYTSW